METVFRAEPFNRACFSPDALHPFIYDVTSSAETGNNGKVQIPFLRRFILEDDRHSHLGWNSVNPSAEQVLKLKRQGRNHRG